VVPRTLASFPLLVLALAALSACNAPAENAKPVPGLEVAWCRLQPLPLAETAPGRAFSASGRVLVPGLTDRTSYPDLDVELDAKLGWGPFGSEPNEPGEAGAWTWKDASPVQDWDGAAAGEPTVDEYRLSTSAPGAGRYGLAFAFSADSGQTWRLCDLGGTPDALEEGDGFSADNVGELVVRSSSDPCDPDPCAVTPVPTCDGNTIVRYTGPGTCTAEGGAYRCDYPSEHTTDCGASGQACLTGACVTPVPVDFCQHLGPADVSYAGEPIPFDGLVQVAGITDRTSGVDLDAALKVAFGYGWPGAQPDGDGWAWVEGGIEGPPGWTDETLPLDRRGADVYRATFDGAPPGDYDTAWRFSADGGATWTYCDLDGAGGGQPYDPTNAGHLSVPEE
jgi:hypothetical protein